MASILDHYRVLGVSVGAGMAEVTSSYRKLCRIYHPDISDDPMSEEKMKRINVAYTALREKLRRESPFRDRAPYSRTARRYSGTDFRSGGADARRTGAVNESEAFAAVQEYFKALSVYDYSRAYDLLSSYDKRQITRESFIKWRASVSRLFPIREFSVDAKSAAVALVIHDDVTVQARKFRVSVTEEDQAERVTSSGDVEKLVINENGVCKVFLGYGDIGELTRGFEERFEARRKRDMAKRFDDYYDGQNLDFDMYSPAGMRKAVSREFYRHKRFGWKLTFAAISIKAAGVTTAGMEELLRSAAKTINGTLRETDIPAYLGDGVFAILFVELRRKHAIEIIAGLVENIRVGAGMLLGARADIEYAFESWSDNGMPDFDSLNNVLSKFSKKL